MNVVTTASNQIFTAKELPLSLGKSKRAVQLALYDKRSPE